MKVHTRAAGLPGLGAGLLLALLIVASQAAAQTSGQYTIEIHVGWNLIANQLERGNNTLDEVIPNAPDGARLYKFDNVAQRWESSVYDASRRAWQPGQITLNPGEGAFFYSPIDFPLTFRGTPRSRFLPPYIPPGECWLLSAQIPQAATYENVGGEDPRHDAVVYKWNVQTYDGYTFDFRFGWNPSDPFFAVGESAWFCPEGGGIPPLPSQPPTISDIPDQVTSEDTPVGPLAFTIGDVETSAKDLTLKATSSNPSLVPKANIVFGGGDSNRTVTVIPAPNQFGTNVVTVTVTDKDGASTNDTFVLIVNPVNDLPALSDIPDQVISEDSTTGPISFTIGDIETPASNLVLTASTSNSSLVPLANIVFGGTESNRTVTVTPAPDQAGTNVVTVTVTDGDGASTSDTFVVIVTPNPPLLVSVDALCLESNLIVTFSESVDPVSSLEPSRYAISAIGQNVSVLSVEQPGADRHVLTLHLNAPVSPRVLYTLTATVVGVTGGQGVSSIDFTCSPCLRGSAGKEFWLTFPGNYAVNPIDAPSPLLIIAGQPGTAGTVSVGRGVLTEPAAPFTVNFVIPQGGMAVVGLPREADLAGANDLIEDKGVHVSANGLVTVYGVNYMPHSTDAYLALPVAALGRAHVVMTYQNLSTAGAPDLNGVQLAIVATQDGTTVTLVPSADVGAHPAGVPFSRTLERGQTFQLVNTDAAPVDLTGTLIFADHPIAVFGSHQCASVPSANDVFLCNHLVEQLPPSQLWGTEFVTMPLATRSGGDTFRFLALSGGATVTVNGAAIPGLLDRGQFHEVRLDKPAHITADRPILVAQFAHSSDFDWVTNADPFMVLIPPTRLFASDYIVPTGFAQNYINIVAPTGTPVLLDGNPILVDSPIAASGYSGATVPAGSGSHTLSSTDGTPFGVIVYGWELYDSYGYPGGLCQMSDQGQPPPCACPPSQVDLPIDSNCVARVPDMRGFLADCYLFVTQDPAPGEILPPGKQTITTTIFDLLGNRKDCFTSVTGSGPRFPDIVTNCVSPAGTVVEYAVPSCGTNNFDLTCNPPSGSLFAPGTTTVTCVGTDATGNEVSASFTVTVRCLTIALEAPDTVVVTWTGGGVLEAAPAVTGPWRALLNAPSPFTSQITDMERQRFFRVRFGQ